MRDHTFLAWLLLVSSGCAAIQTHWRETTSPVFYLDPSFSRQEVADLQEAADHWCRAADTPAACPKFAGVATWHPPMFRDGGSLTFYRGDPEPTVWRADRGDPLYEGLTPVGKILIDGMTDGRSVVLFTENLENRADWVQTMLHELGHTLGLGHDVGGSMIKEIPCVDRKALVALCSLIECGPRAHSTCKDE